MIGRPRLELAYEEWPQELQQLWQAAFKTGAFLDEAGPGAHLAPATRIALKGAFGRFLGFLKRQQRLRKAVFWLSQVCRCYLKQINCQRWLLTCFVNK